MSEVLLKNVLIERNDALELCHIKITGRKISEIATADVSVVGECDVYDFRGEKIAVPGFVNTHTHSPMSLLRGFAEDLPFDEWLFRRILPAEERITPEAAYYGALVSMMEMASHGVVAFCDMYFHMDEVAKAVADFGLKALLTRGLVDKDGDDGGRLDENVELYKKWHGFDERIYVGLGPHAPYTCSEAYLKRVLEVAEHENMIVTMHFFENAWERERYSPEEIVSLGFDRVHFIPVHCVHLREGELRLLQGAYPTLCVMSNMKLGTGLPPVLEMFEAGLDVTVGTDGPASNNSLNPLLDGRLLSLTGKLRRPEGVKVSEVLHALTRAGYEALGLEGGELRPGAPADIVLVDAKHTQLQPLSNFSANLIHAYTDRVFATMVNGRFIYYDGTFPTIDAEEVLRTFSTFSKRVTGTES